MARRAVWRTLPDDPRTLLGWLLADEGSHCLPPAVVGGLALAIAMFAVAWSPWIFATLPLLALQARLPRPPRDLAPLATVPSPGSSFACRLDVWHNDVLLGTDEGVVTLLDGWLHYMGHRTEFAFRPSDATGSGGRGMSPAVLFGDERVEFAPLYATEPPTRPADLQSGFFETFNHWLRTTPAVEGEPILPPQSVHATGQARARRAILKVFAFYLAAVPVLLLLFHAGAWIVFAFGGVDTEPFWRLRRLRRLSGEELRASETPAIRGR